MHMLRHVWDPFSCRCIYMRQTGSRLNKCLNSSTISRQQCARSWQSTAGPVNASHGWRSCRFWTSIVTWWQEKLRRILHKEISSWNIQLYIVLIDLRMVLLRWRQLWRCEEVISWLLECIFSHYLASSFFLFDNKRSPSKWHVNYKSAGQHKWIPSVDSVVFMLLCFSQSPFIALLLIINQH